MFDRTANSKTGEVISPGRNPHPTVVRGFSQTYGLVPMVTATVFITDTMLFGAESASLGTLWPVSLVVSAVIGVITFLAQRKFYGDDDEAAFIKAALLSLLVAIPTPLPAMLYIPAGIIGLCNRKRG